MGQSKSQESIDHIKRQLNHLQGAMERSYNVDLQRLYEERRARHPNPLVHYGRKVFSQSDEDGITFELCKRLHLGTGTFLEFGVGNGLENNTLALLASGWRGAWFGGQDLDLDVEKSSRLSFTKSWITKENILDLTQAATSAADFATVDLVSLDLDGNDYYLVETLLAGGVTPAIFVVEYNGKLAPPIEFKIDYDPQHKWAGDDYFGASLSAWNALFKTHKYTLVACNAATGVNAFFVADAYADHFTDVPRDIGSIYSDPNYHLLNFFGHKPSVRTIETLIR